MIENQLLEIQSTLKDAPLGQKAAGAANTGTVDVEETDTIPEQVVEVAKSRLLPTLVAVAAVAGFARIQQVGIRDMLPFRNRRADWPMYALLTLMVWQQVRDRL